MKKITLLLSALMIAGVSFACDGDKGKKGCCKKSEKTACCKKDSKHCKDAAKAEKTGEKEVSKK